MVRISLLLPVLASIELARKANVARMQGLKPAKRPAAKTVTIDDKLRLLRVFPVAHALAAVNVVCESLLAKADEIRSNAAANKIALMKCRAIFIFVLLKRLQ